MKEEVVYRSKEAVFLLSDHFDNLLSSGSAYGSGIRSEFLGCAANVDVRIKMTAADC